MNWPSEYMKARMAFFDMRMSTRLQNCLIYEGIYTLEDAAKLTEAELLAIPNLGRRCLNEIKALLAERGMKPRHPDMDDPLLRSLLVKAESTRDALQKASAAHGEVTAAIKRRRKELGI